MKKKLSEILNGCLFTDGDWIESKDQDPNGEVRLIQLADIGDGNFIDKSTRFINRGTALKLKCTFLKKGDVLIARMPDPLGRACVFPLDEENKYVTAVDVCIIRPKENCLAKYLMYTLNSKEIRNTIERQKTGTTRERITRKKLGELKIPLPPLDQQKKIASILDAADAYRQKTKALISKYDELTQSLFLDMFGDPVKNEKGWEVKELGNLTKLITDGKHGNCNDEQNSGYYFVSAKDVRNNKINFKESRQIPKIEFEEVDKRTNLQAGDLVMINTGATIGRMAIAEEIPETRRCTFQKSVAIIKVKPEYLKTMFLKYVFELGLDSFVNKGSGSAIKNLLLSEMRRFRIIVPKLTFQNQFAERVQAIEQQKAQAQESLEKADELFDSLLQKAFNGELVEP